MPDHTYSILLKSVYIHKRHLVFDIWSLSIIYRGFLKEPMSIWINKITVFRDSDENFREFFNPIMRQSILVPTSEKKVIYHSNAKIVSTPPTKTSAFHCCPIRRLVPLSTNFHQRLASFASLHRTQARFAKLRWKVVWPKHDSRQKLTIFVVTKLISEEKSIIIFLLAYWINNKSPPWKNFLNEYK